MKIKNYLAVSMMAAMGAVAQGTNPMPPGGTPPLPAIPAPAAPAAPAGASVTEAPVSPAATEKAAPKKKAATKHHKKVIHKTTKATAKSAATEKETPAESNISLVAGTANVVASDLNVRGQAGLKGEVVAHLQKGDTVTVLSQINLSNHKAGEPSQWAKILLPSGTKVWVRSSFINSSDKSVEPKKLNFRAGPSEDYSVLGVLEHGTVVNVVETKGEWDKIDAPSGAFGFVAANYLRQDNTNGLGANPILAGSPENGMTVPPPAAASTPVPAPELVAAPPAGFAPPPPQESLNPSLAISGNLPPSSPPAAPEMVQTQLAPSPRIVTHEGYVRDSISLVAPTYFELYDPTSQRAIDYLHSTTTNLDLSRYDGFQIIVTGEEGLDARWKDTPVLSVQKIYVVSTNKPVVPVLKSPRASTMH